jgi:hypothetical protein
VLPTIFHLAKKFKFLLVYFAQNSSSCLTISNEISNNCYEWAQLNISERHSQIHRNDIESICKESNIEGRMDEEEEQRKNTFKPLIFICERERTEQTSREIVKKRERRIKIASLRLVVARMPSSSLSILLSSLNSSVVCV